MQWLNKGYMLAIASSYRNSLVVAWKRLLNDI